MEYRVQQSIEYGVWSVEYGVQSMECRVQSIEYRVQNCFCRDDACNVKKKFGEKSWEFLVTSYKYKIVQQSRSMLRLSSNTVIAFIENKVIRFRFVIFIAVIKVFSRIRILKLPILSLSKQPFVIQYIQQGCSMLRLSSNTVIAFIENKVIRFRFVIFIAVIKVFCMIRLLILPILSLSK